VRKTWAPVGQTPILRHSYRHDKVSDIFAVTISSLRQWIGLYFQCHRDNINSERVVGFLRLLLRHLRGEVVLLWDGGKIHRNEAVRHYLQRCRRLYVHRFPAYAPELNPDEHIWTQAKQALANSTPNTAAELECHPDGVLFRLQHSPNRLWSCIDAAELPWK
jgi:transposase